MSKTKIVCPHCGTEFEIPETSHIAIGVVIGKDSNLGTISPKAVNKDSAPKKKPLTADERLEALRKAGVDTTGMFAVNGASSEGMVVRIKDGNPVKVEDDDPVFKSIVEGGTIPERNLFRRWVMSQMFHMLAHYKGFTEALKEKGYNYQWKMIQEEFRVQAVLSKKDPENFEERNRWFNKTTLLCMINDYINKLLTHVSSLTIHRCKGVPYIHFNGKDIFLSDIDKRLVEPAKDFARVLENNNLDPEQLATAAYKFNRIRKKLPDNTHHSNVWVSAYKGSGAYYTLKNLILFHGCRFRNGCVKMSEEASIKTLDKYAESFKNEGYKMFAVLKQFISDNGIDIKAKMKEWAKK